MPRKSSKPRPNVFASDYAPYGHAEAKGNPSQWKASYEQRMMGEEEAVAVLDKDNPYTVLKIPQGANKDAVKAAYRKIVLAECRTAFDVNADPAVVEKFKKIHAAYSFLMGK